MQFILCNSILGVDLFVEHSFISRIPLKKTTQVQYVHCYLWPTVFTLEKSLPVAIPNTLLKNKQTLSALFRKQRRGSHEQKFL